MKSAKEMFKELGFDFYYCAHDFTEIYHTIDFIIEICTASRTVSIGHRYYGKGKEMFCELPYEVFQAINKRIEELRCIND